MKTPRLKPDTFADCCGLCRFCHPGEIGNFHCWVEPPKYAGYVEDDTPVFFRGQAEVKCREPACRDYVPKNQQ